MSGRHRGTDRRWRRRSAAGLIAAGLLSVGAGSAGMVTAHAAGEPGANFGSVDITAIATGLRTPFYSHSGEDVEAELPFARAIMQSGGVAHSLTSVFWPGDTGGNGGSTLYLLTGSCLPPRPGNYLPIPGLPDPPCVTTVPALPQPVYENLNDSYKAEAQSGTGDSTVRKSNQGVDMVATATTTKSASSTAMAGGKLPNGDTFGATQSSTNIRFTGPNTAVVDAVSVVRNVSLGGGALTIDTVKSVAHAVTDGKVATGAARTTVSGMKIAGTPVTVDNTGIHVAGQGHGLPSLDALNQALAKSGFKVFVADPTKRVKGHAATLYSGQLIVTFTNGQYNSNANDSTTVLTLGGAGISADTTRGYNFIGQPAPLPSSSSAPVPPSTGSTGSGPSLGAPSGGSGVTPPGPDVASSAPPAAPPVLAAQHTSLPGGISPALVVVVLLGAGLIAAGLKRLPDQVLAAGATTCPLGEQS